MQALRFSQLISRCLGLSMLCSLVLADGRLGWSQVATDGRPSKSAEAVAVSGLVHRIPWTTSNVKGFPEPPPPLQLVEAYPRLKFPKLITLGRIPNSHWLLAVDHENDYAGGSRAAAFRDKVEVDSAETFLETPEIIYGLAWHPEFPSQPWVYVGCNGSSDQSETVVTKVLRFRVETTQLATGEDGYRCVPESRVVIIEWPSNGHNGGDLAFGNDGMLYVSAGDGTSDSDVDRNGQNLSTLAGSLLRIDIHGAADVVAADLHAENTGTASVPAMYRVPADNPFVNYPQARGEIWAYGLRNPWRISFDSLSNQLWVGNNGQDLWESVYLVERGANYGWSINESNHPFHTQQNPGPAPISQATVEHAHSEARSLTGGHVYRGTQFPELSGAFIYGDYSTGNIWAVRHDGQQVVYQRLIARSRVQMTDFGFDSQGEMLIADHAGTIYRFAASSTTETHEFPRQLSQTGLFHDTPRQIPAAGVIPYSVNSPLWSDGAIKQRWLAVPNTETIGFTDRGSWDFPEGTILVKSFAFPTKPAGEPRLVETRLFAKQQGEWYGYSYRWTADQSEAYLVDEPGHEELLDWVSEDGVFKDSVSKDGVVQNELVDAVRWRYPSRSECMVCHSRAAKFVLGVSTEQLHRSHQYIAEDGQSVVAPQLQSLAHIGLFGDSWKSPEPDQLPQLVDPYDPTQNLDARARSYLHTNCASCHVEAGGGNSKIVLDYFTPVDKMRLRDAEPLHHNFGLPAAKLVAPGAPERSVLYARLARRGPGQMPPLATFRIDQAALDLIRQWIAQ